MESILYKLFDNDYDITPERDKKQLEFIGLFNQIKQEYNLARYLWYSVSTDTHIPGFPDQELDLLDTGDYADHSLKESLLRTAFKSAYSLFDRIGFFINQYWSRQCIVFKKISLKRKL